MLFGSAMVAICSIGVILYETVAVIRHPRGGDIALLVFGVVMLLGALAVFAAVRRSNDLDEGVDPDETPDENAGNDSDGAAD